MGPILPVATIGGAVPIRVVRIEEPLLPVVPLSLVVVMVRMLLLDLSGAILQIACLLVVDGSGPGVLQDFVLGVVQPALRVLCPGALEA